MRPLQKQIAHGREKKSKLQLMLPIHEHCDR